MSGHRSIPVLTPYPTIEPVDQLSQPIMQFKELEVDALGYDEWKRMVGKARRRRKRAKGGDAK